MTIKNSRIRNLFADGVNMTNGSTDNLVDNNDARATGDDSFALFSAIDAGGSDEINNVYSNLSSTLTWRAAGIAVYGGYANTFRNIYIADTLVYSGITISSLDFGYPMNGFGASPPTVFDNISIVRAGGHFWGDQVFPAIWVFSASKVFQGIRVSNVDIVDPTYSGIMFQTNYVGGQPQNPITDTVFTDVTITGAQQERGRVRREVGLRRLGEPDAGAEPGSGGRLGDVHQPAAEQQLPGHRERDQHLHHQPQLTGAAPRGPYRFRCGPLPWPAVGTAARWTGVLAAMCRTGRLRQALWRRLALVRPRFWWRNHVGLERPHSHSARGARRCRRHARRRAGATLGGAREQRFGARSRERRRGGRGGVPAGPQPDRAAPRPAPAPGDRGPGGADRRGGGAAAARGRARRHHGGRRARCGGDPHRRPARSDGRLPGGHGRGGAG